MKVLSSRKPIPSFETLISIGQLMMFYWYGIICCGVVSVMQNKWWYVCDVGICTQVCVYLTDFLTKDISESEWINMCVDEG